MTANTKKKLSNLIKSEVLENNALEPTEKPQKQDRHKEKISGDCKLGTRDLLRDLMIKDKEFGNGTIGEYLEFLIVQRKEYLEKPSIEELSREDELMEEKQEFFKNSKHEKLTEIKKALEMPENENLMMTPWQLITKASQLSGVSITEIKMKGIIREAQDLILAFYSDDAVGRGKLGKLDKDLDKALVLLADEFQKHQFNPPKGIVKAGHIQKRAEMLLMMLGNSRSSSINYNTFKKWLERRKTVNSDGETVTLYDELKDGITGDRFLGIAQKFAQDYKVEI